MTGGGDPLDLVGLREHPAFVAGNLLDIREASAFQAGHLPGAASLPLELALAAVPSAQREAWLAANLASIFLPPRHEPLIVCAWQTDLAVTVAGHLTRRGRAPVQGLGLASMSGADWPADLRRRGPSRRTLWQPPPFLVRWAHLLPPPVSGPVLDLACGSGRAAVWLAERHWRVTGIDHQPEALDLARQLAASRGVTLDLLEADLRQPSSLPAGPWSVVLLHRYLDRPLMRRLPTVLADGAVVVLRTFRDAPGYVGNPQPRHRLRRDEAAGLLPAAATEVLVHEEGFDPDGRPAAGVVLRWTTPAGEGGVAGEGRAT